MGAILDTDGWLTLIRQGLAPCKMHQASLGALTSKSAARFLRRLYFFVREFTSCHSKN